MAQRETEWNSCLSGEVTDRRFNFEKNRQFFRRTHNDTLSVAVSVNSSAHSLQARIAA